MSGFTDDIPRGGTGSRRLVEALSAAQHMPVEAIEEAARRPDRVAEPVLAVVRRAAAGEALDGRDANLLFWGVHVLGAGGDTRLCAPLLALMRRSDERTLDLLGDALAGSLARVVISVFDGDADGLAAAIADRNADGYARWCLFGALAFLTATGAVERDVTAALLARFDVERLAPGGDPAWIGWEEVIALCGFAELAERVGAARADARLLDDVSDPEWFAATLAEAVAEPGSRARFDDKELGPVGDVVADLERTLAEGEEEAAPEPVVNPFRDVGRNDPCPCGSGRKFKKCCLAA